MLRLTYASNTGLEYVESVEYIPTAKLISAEFIPLRSIHGILPAYLIRASALLFGESALGFRMFSVIAGVATILLLYLIGVRWWGAVAGLTAAALLAFERYHVEISGRAQDLSFDLFFITLSIYCFSRFLHTLDRSAETKAGLWLYGTATACALGFLCKELTALMAPVLLLSLVLTGQSAWLRRRQTWLAVALFALIISPDVYASLSTGQVEQTQFRERYIEVLKQSAPGRAHDLPAPYMSYGEQLGRFKSIGFNLEPFYFYFGEVFDALGMKHDNLFSETPFMNPWLAITLWIGVIFSFFRRDKDKLTIMLLTMFTALLLAFASVRLGIQSADRELPTDGALIWYWSDRTMLPAMLLAGQTFSILVRMSALASRWRLSHKADPVEQR